jgi:hypothetical protein
MPCDGTPGGGAEKPRGPALVKQQGMEATTIVVSGEAAAQRRSPADSEYPLSSPGYGQRSAPYYQQPPYQQSPGYFYQQQPRGYYGPNGY